jgi:hypothetical protein
LIGKLDGYGRSAAPAEADGGNSSTDMEAFHRLEKSNQEPRPP